jgi:hypothetical protein
MGDVLRQPGQREPAVVLRASLRGSGSMPSRWRRGSLTLEPDRWRFRRYIPGWPAIELQPGELHLERTRGSWARELLAIDRSCHIAVARYRGMTVELAIRPADLPALWAAWPGRDGRSNRDRRHDAGEPGRAGEPGGPG